MHINMTPFCILIAKKVVVISILDLNYFNRTVTFIAERSDNTLIKQSAHEHNLDFVSIIGFVFDKA